MFTFPLKNLARKGLMNYEERQDIDHIIELNIELLGYSQAYK